MAGSAIIASSGSFLSAVVEEYDIGFSVDPDPAKLTAMLSAITQQDLTRWSANSRKIGARLKSDGGWGDIVAGYSHIVPRGPGAHRIFG
jgi:hypothetical protein